MAKREKRLWAYEAVLGGMAVECELLDAGARPRTRSQSRSMSWLR